MGKTTCLKESLLQLVSIINAMLGKRAELKHMLDPRRGHPVAGRNITNSDRPRKPEEAMRLWVGERLAIEARLVSPAGSHRDITVELQLQPELCLYPEDLPMWTA